jgi:TolA-binding protein
MRFLKLGCGLLLVSALAASAHAPAAGRQTGANAGQGTAAQSDELAQMRDDLNKLESLNLNMSSEIEFLHDQNLQILLRTNSQMWGVLIRDLRRQIDREEQRTRSRQPEDSGRTGGPGK